MTIDAEILCIHYYFPPIRSGGVIRNYYFAKAFAEIFKHVHVITTSNVDVMEQEEMPLPSNITIYKAKTSDFRSSMKKTNHLSMQMKSSPVYRFLSKLKKTLPFHFYLDEGGRRYILDAMRIGDKLLGESPISHIYSSFMPYADHLIASKLKRAHPAVKWIADFRDLQNEPIYHNIYFPAWNDRQERKIVAEASCVTTVSEGLAHALQKIHPKVRSIPRGIHYKADHQPKMEQFTIAYTGSLFFDFRDGGFFVKALRNWLDKRKLQAENCRFVYAGRDGQKWLKWIEEYGLSSFFEDRGFVSREEALRIQADANVLLLLSSSSQEHQGVFTGKLWEYLEGNSEILCVINGTRDKEFERLFAETEAGKIVYSHEEDRIVSILDELYLNFSEAKLPKISEAAQKAREQMNWNARAKALLYD